MIGRLNDDRLVDIVDLSVSGIAMKANSRLAVGRELKMIELKNRIEELESNH